MYRHPKAPTESFNYITESLRNIMLRNKPMFVFGDFNDDILKRDNKMSKLINNLKLDQLINTPTRITSNSSSLTDLVITSNKKMVNHLQVIASPVADHEAVSVSLNISKPNMVAKMLLLLS